MRAEFSNDDIPYFAWDRALTAGQIRAELRREDDPAWPRIAAWIMREAAVKDVWQFLSPQTVNARFPDVEPHLGRRREFWRYLLRTWHELGKL
jgi:hypothetical protein